MTDDPKNELLSHRVAVVVAALDLINKGAEEVVVHSHVFGQECIVKIGNSHA